MSGSVVNAPEQAYGLFLDLLAGLRRHLAGMGDLVATFRVGRACRLVFDGAVGVPGKQREWEWRAGDDRLTYLGEDLPGRGDDSDRVTQTQCHQLGLDRRNRGSALTLQGFQAPPCAR